MRKLILFGLLALSAPLYAEEWSSAIKKKQGKAFDTSMHDRANAQVAINEKLDFGAYTMKLGEIDHLVVRLRNGKHKMGGNAIALKSKATESVTFNMGRVDIAKPMSIVLSKSDGAHLFETFVDHDITYEIYFHIKGGELEPKVTVTSK